MGIFLKEIKPDMGIKNTNDRYGTIAIFLHWVMAFIIIFMLALGLYMVRLPVSPQKIKLFGWHKEFGMLILMLACFRIGWRLASTIPTLPKEIPSWQKIAARTVHWAMYVFMFAMPITGWLTTSAADFPVSFFGLFTIPTLIAPDAHLRELFGEIHEWIAYGLIATICIHIAAAIKHHFINKDNVLIGMLP